MRLCSLLICLLATAVCAAPAGPQLGVKFSKRQNELPTLTLPYGTWRASEYNADADVYVFKNIRFAAAPIGNLRWRKPQPPANNDTIQDGSYGPICVQAPIEGLNLLGPGNNSPIGGAINQFLAGIPVPIFEGGSEDCLFLDLFVPGDAVRDPDTHSLPVIVWIYGGAYVFGSKDALDLIGFYSGTGLIQQSGGNVIYVAGNYRLGTYGFLAGETMENDGVPNAGFWDQRAVFQWVQDYIGLVGGDASNVNAWGESAGAGSILHHLTAQGGTLDPLFKKAVALSSAFQIMWDRKGGLENIFQNFSALAGCEGQGLDCLRAADPATLDTANEALIRAAPESAFNIGPAADGDYVRQLPMLEFASGNYWKGLDSLIISHTADESELFVDGHIQTDEQFNGFIDSVFPTYVKEAGINAAIEEFYPPVSTNDTYATVTERTKAFVRDSSFTCWSRFLTDAYDGKSWNMQYSVSPGWHGTDLLPLFYQIYVSFGGDVAFPLIPGFGSFATAYQSYFTSHARSGDPNTHSAKINLPPAINWPHPTTGGENLGNVLNVGNLGFSLKTDEQLPKSSCDFILELAAAVTNVGGYAVPGTAQPQSLVEFDGDPSANYE
ncbi:Secreted lipase [Lasiodiplodia hormozganensis]|uniref:Secreted lipase n=1 Tax=Lasiodiplodia hormozganensis TaxID=869390 RepID=A0AA39XUA5_9PEZI|nr:Secreted lipase [Lasiodiplodia hormozganensis]